MDATQRGWSRDGCTLLIWGIAALAFGVVTLIWPGVTVLAMVLTFGVLSIVEGGVSLLGGFRKASALPNWLLLLYALVSIGFGALAVTRPAQMAAAMLWLLALWLLLLAGAARIGFALQGRYASGSRAHGCRR